MAFITAEEVKAIRQALKKEFGKTMKFSVTKEHHTAVNIKILESSKVNFTENPEYVHNAWGAPEESPYISSREECQEVFDKIDKIAKTAPVKAGGREWFNESDAMTDYFHCAYYIFTSVGKWNKPYKFVG